MHQEVAHLGHVELLTPRPDESMTFFTDVLGLEVTQRQGQSVFLRAWGDYERHTLKLTEAPTAGVGHTAWRAMSPEALERRAAVLAQNGHGLGWIDGDAGHGKSYQFHDPDGHLMELYYETEWYEPEAQLKPFLKNQPQRYTGRGAAVRRLDHINMLCAAVTPNREFMADYLGFKLREHIILDDGTEAGAWISVTPLVHDIAYTLDATRARGRLHHLAWATDTREEVLRAADICLEHNVFIETGPSKHAVTHGFFLYMYEPGGNRIEIFSGGYLIFAPDWRPIVWNQQERARGQAWGLKLPHSFHTYGTPHVDIAEVELLDIPVVGVE